MATYQQKYTTQPIKTTMPQPPVQGGYTPLPNTVTGNNWITDHAALPPPPGGDQNRAIPGGGWNDSYAPPNMPGMPMPPQQNYGPQNPYPYSPFAPVGTAAPPTMPGPPTGGGATQPGGGGNFNPWNPNEKNFYGGQQIAGAMPGPADYGSVQNYADSAYQNSRRYLDPQQETQNKRMAQTLINQGIDPNSPQGQQRMKMLGMQQADQDNAAAFGAMQFGQGIQNQMAQQEFQKAGLAGQMQQALWGAQLGSSQQGLQKYLGDMQNKLGWGGLQNQKYGMDLNYNLGLGGLDMQRYGLDLQNNLNMGQLDLAQQMANWNQMMGQNQFNFQQSQWNDQLDMYNDQMMMALLGQNPVPGVSPTNPYTPYGQQAGSGQSWWNWG